MERPFYLANYSAFGNPWYDHAYPSGYSVDDGSFVRKSGGSSGVVVLIVIAAIIAVVAFVIVRRRRRATAAAPTGSLADTF